MDYQDAMEEQRAKQNQIGKLNKTVYAIVWAQCSESMRAKISGLPEYHEFCAESNGMALLQAIKSVSFNFEESVYRIDAIQEALWQLMSCRQSPYATVQEYYDAFRNSHNVYIHTGGHTTLSPGTLAMLAMEKNLGMPGELTADQVERAKERELAALFI
jgi:hypothetical protein